MTREERAAALLDLLDPAAERRAECLYDIEKMLNWVADGCAASARGKLFGSKRGKAALNRYEGALEDVRGAYAALDPAIRSWFTLPDGIDRELSRVRNLREDREPKPDAVAAKLATMVSYSLLVWWGHKPTLSHGGVWWRAAKIMADSKASPLEHMRAFRKQPVYIDKIAARNGVLYRVRKPKD